MTPRRLFLMCFTTIVWVFLSGLTLLNDNEADLANNKNVTITPVPIKVESNVKQLKAKKPENIVELRSKKTVRVEAARKQKSLIHSELDNPLDLSIPFKASEKFDFEKTWLIPHQTLDVFAVDPHKKARSIELDGDLLMSPDPQPEKRKSVDGAGIIINIKP